MKEETSLGKFIKCDDDNNGNPKSCKVYLQSNRWNTCEEFCESLGYACYDAYKEAAESASCEVRGGSTIGCPGPSNDDYVCGCETRGKNYGIQNPNVYQ